MARLIVLLRLLLLLLLLLAVTALSAACGGGGESQTSALSDREAAQAFLAAVEAWTPEAGAVYDQANRAALSEADGCPARPGHPNRRLDAQFAAATMTFGDLNAIQELVPRLRAFAAELNRIRTLDPALGTVAEAVSVSAEEAQMLAGADLDLCGFLARWRATGWSESYWERWIDSGLEPYGIDDKRLRAAYLRAVDTQDHLRQLGLTFDEALAVSGSARI